VRFDGLLNHRSIESLHQATPLIDSTLLVGTLTPLGVPEVPALLVWAGAGCACSKVPVLPVPHRRFLRREVPRGLFEA